MKLNMKKILSAITHRAVVASLLLILQVILFAVMIRGFTEYLVYFYAVCVVISLVVVLYIINKEGDPGYKIAWIVPILLLPLFGGMIYLLLGANGISRGTREKMRGMEMGMITTLEKDNKAGVLAPLGLDAVNQSRYLEKYAHCPLYGNTKTTYYPLGDDLYEPFLEELRKAKRYIFLEFFIIAPGKFWNAVLDILEDKAAHGVDVRVIYDDVGCMLTLPGNYFKILEEKGIRCHVFNRVRPVLSVRLNNRDHRKICVVDGHTAFTGGFNLADEYINEIRKYGHWKDSGICLQGEGAWPLTVMFLTMWEYITGGKENYETYRPPIQPLEGQESGGWVQPYTDSPLDGEPVGETVYRNLTAKAKNYIYFTTPYLIISDSLNAALCSAAKSGVDVRIITPHIPDKKTVFELTRAHYVPLLQAGVRIYEYTPGFIHAKNCVCDDLYATVGTVNLDYRSMFLHFEDGVWLCGDPTVLDVKEDMLRTMARSMEVTLKEAQAHRFPRRLLRSVLRVFAPLM